MFTTALELIKKIVALEEGATAYVVGGAARDKLLHRPCDDVDIATSVHVDKICENFVTHDIGKNKEFGIAVVEYGGYTYEVANYRTDGDYSDGRHPDSVEIAESFEEDSTRRDFTINAMAIEPAETDPYEFSILDYHDGVEDLDQQLIRTVGDPEDRFWEDFLRMMRAVRFATVLDFTIEENTMKAIQKYADRITQVSWERIWKEFYKMAESPNFADGLRLLKESGMLKHILPEVDIMDTFEHSEHHHPEGNVWEHTLAVIELLADESAIVKLAGLFHDIGKPVTHSKGDDGVLHYYRHDFKGEFIMEEISKRLKIPNNVHKEVVYSITNHMRMHLFMEMRVSKCYDLMDSPYWESLYKIGNADDKSRLHLYSQDKWNKMDDRIEFVDCKIKLQTRMKEVINGDIVMELLGIPTGKKVGEVVKKTRNWIMNNNIDIDNVNLINGFIQGCK